MVFMKKIEKVNFEKKSADGNKCMKNHQNVVAQYPLHPATHAATKFKAAATDGLGEDAFT